MISLDFFQFSLFFSIVYIEISKSFQLLSSIFLNFFNSLIFFSISSISLIEIIFRFSLIFPFFSLY